MRWQVVLGCVLVSALLGSCTATRNLSSTNLSDIYRVPKLAPNPDFQIYHLSDSVSRIYFRINSEDLSYAKAEDEAVGKCQVRFAYRLFTSYESAQPIDTGSVYFSDFGGPKPARDLIGSFDLKIKGNQNLLLQITTQDQIRKKESTKYEVVFKRTVYNRQNFLVRSAGKEAPVFDPYLKPGQEVTIECREGSKLYGRYYNRKFPISLAPFALYNPKPFDYSADSLFQIPLPDSGRITFTTPDSGFVHFSTKSDVKTGLTLYGVSETFPKTNSAEELLLPLRYVMTKSEYMKMQEIESPKQALDEFWLKSSQNPDRAKELIRKYYKRVQHANRFFSSYMEGWKTDRGMVYIVFGPPNIIYKSSNSESWVYGEENNYMSLTLNFIKVSNPFSANDFRLNRSPIYKSNWYRAVESWRQGRVLVNN